MQHYAGIDVSLELLSVCIVDTKGKIVKEAKVGSDPDTLVAFLRGLDLAIERIGLEAGPLSQWLHAGLTSAGFEAVLLETRHVKAALSAMTVKTDRKDARGIAQLIRMGWFRAVHCKSAGSQEVRALLVARKLLLSKLLDVEFSIRGILRGFGLKMGMVTRKRFEARVRDEGLSNAQGRVMDAHDLDIEDATFDVTGSQFGVSLVRDQPLGLREMVRVTKPGGSVLVIAYGSPDEFETLQLFIAALQAVVPDFEGLPDDPPPLDFQMADPEVMRRRLTDAGLKDVVVDTTHKERVEFGSGQQMWTGC